MRVAVVGAGSLGGLFGAQLVRAGVDVTFIARGATLAVLRRDGLSVRSATLGDFTVPVNATDDPASVGAVDLVLLGVKLYDLEAATEQAKPLVGDSTVVLTLQNGIDAASRVNAVLGGDHALTGVGYVNAGLDAPGIVRHLAALNEIVLGEPAGGTSPRATAVAEVLSQGGIDAQTPDDVRIPMWDKFILLAGTAGVLAVTRLPLGPIRESSEMWQFFLGVIREAEAVARALGIGLPSDALDVLAERIQGLPYGARSSMLQDLVAGRRLELDGLNGAIVRLGRELGVPTPLNFAIYAALEAYRQGPPEAATA